MIENKDYQAESDLRQQEENSLIAADAVEVEEPHVYFSAIVHLIIKGRLSAATDQELAKLRLRMAQGELDDDIVSAICSRDGRIVEGRKVVGRVETDPVPALEQLIVEFDG